MKRMRRKAIKANTVITSTNPNAIVDEIIIKLTEMLNYAQDINNAISSKDGEVYDVDELKYDAENIVDELSEAFQVMGEMADYQDIFK